MNHNQKIKLAKRMSGGKLQTGFFLTNAWERRKQAIVKRVENKNKRVRLAIQAKKDRLKFKKGK